MTLDAILDRYDRRQLSRRELTMALAALFAAGGAPAQEGSTFDAVGLDHIALRVTDLGRSRAFYERHLGLRTTSTSSSSVFLQCGPNFLALFRSDRPGLDHYSFALERYDQQDAAERLRAADLEPRLRGRRIYFDDPDGIEVQLSRGEAAG